MASITVCMITKNEEDCVAEALQSVKDLADEIIVVDTGSKDKTVEMVSQFTNNVFHKQWDYDFAEMRNFSLEHATKDWILVIDADEVIAEADHPKIKQVIEDPNIDAYTLEQLSYTKDTTQFGYTPVSQSSKETKGFPGFISCNIIRLFRNHKNIQFANPVHESVDASIPKEKVKQTTIPIHHYQFTKGNDNQKEKQLHYLKIYETKLDKFTNKAKVYRDMGIIYMQFKQEFAKAIECFEHSLQHNPDNVKTYVGLIIAYMNTRQLQEAWKVVQEAERRAPTDRQIQQLKQEIISRITQQQG